MSAGSLDNSTVLLSHSEQEHDNNPLDNLADLREIHQFEIDLSNYTDHQAVETDIEHDIPEFNDHFDIIPDMDTRDYHNSSEESMEKDKKETLNPELYEVVTAPPTAEEAFDTDSEELEINEGMDDKYFTLLENLRKKIMAEKALSEKELGKEIHEEENDILHPLISLMAIKPHSMRLLVKPKTLDANSMVLL